MSGRPLVVDSGQGTIAGASALMALTGIGVLVAAERLQLLRDIEEHTDRMAIALHGIVELIALKSKAAHLSMCT